MRIGPAVGFSLTTLSTMGHSVLPIDLISFFLLIDFLSLPSYKGH